MNNAKQLATPISYRMVMTLRDEAAAHGDLAMVATCEAAMRGGLEALRIVAQAIADAQDRADD